MRGSAAELHSKNIISVQDKEHDCRRQCCERECIAVVPADEAVHVVGNTKRRDANRDVLQRRQHAKPNSAPFAAVSVVWGHRDEGQLVNVMAGVAMCMAFRQV